MSRRGLRTRAMGRRRMLASPVSTQRKGSGATSPGSRRMSVPAFRTSITSVGLAEALPAAAVDHQFVAVAPPPSRPAPARRRAWPECPRNGGSRSLSPGRRSRLPAGRRDARPTCLRARGSSPQPLVAGRKRAAAGSPGIVTDGTPGRGRHRPGFPRTSSLTGITCERDRDRVAETLYQGRRGLRDILSHR